MTDGDSYGRIAGRARGRVKTGLQPPPRCKLMFSCFERCVPGRRDKNASSILTRFNPSFLRMVLMGSSSSPLRWMTSRWRALRTEQRWQTRLFSRP